MNRRGFFGMLAGLFGGLMLPRQANCRPILRARQVTGLMMPSKKYPLATCDVKALQEYIHYLSNLPETPRTRKRLLSALRVLNKLDEMG